MSEINHQLVNACYQLILGRRPDEGGLSQNVAFLNRYGDLDVVIRSLVMSEEFKVKQYDSKV